MWKIIFEIFLKEEKFAIVSNTLVFMAREKLVVSKPLMLELFNLTNNQRTENRKVYERLLS